MSLGRRLTVFVCVALGIIACGSLAVFILWHEKPWSTNAFVKIPKAEIQEAPIEMSLAPATPRQIIIPKLKIDVSVEKVGKNDAGEMAAPSTLQTVGWYRYGFLPGARGNAVFAGHYGNETTDGIFHKLQQLTKGDIVYVLTEAKKMKFKVTKRNIYKATTQKLKEVFGKSDSAQLQLITCDGVWNAETQTYDKRLAVTARFISESEAEMN